MPNQQERERMNTVIKLRGDDSIQPIPNSQQRVVDIVLKEDDLNWKDLIYNLIQEENMDPWDIDLALLSKKFIELLDTLKKMDFRIGGKMVLTASLLLKIKSDNLMNDGIESLNSLIEDSQEEYLDDSGFDQEPFEFEQLNIDQFLNDERKLVPRTPQPRERKVSVFDLVDALESALATDMRRKFSLSRSQKEDVEEEPERKNEFDLLKKMNSLQGDLKKLFTKKKTKVFLHDLLPENYSKEDLIFTFLPLLHLENQRKVDLAQEEHFGPVEVSIFNRKL